jgi:hypothetical protein
VDLRWLGAVVSIIALGAILPVLRTHLFYYWDDSAAYFLPNWRIVGEHLRQGSLPILSIDGWMGGDWAGEAQLGIWNPLVMANALLVSFIPDLAVSAILVK